MINFGQANQPLGKAIRAVALGDTTKIRFSEHAVDRMEERALDQADVMTCLRKGTTYGPELRDGDVRANVVHRGLKIRVVVGGLKAANGDWSKLTFLRVVSVMETT